jgi:hypothetical protein
MTTNINKFSAKPQLIKVTLDNPDLIENYGEPIIFYMYSVVGIQTYFEFFDSRNSNNMANLDRMIRAMILDESGEPALAADEQLPVDIAAEAIVHISERLGNLQIKK